MELKFRAIIDSKTIVYFTLTDLIDPTFSIRELLIPWLEAGNIPDLYTGLKDKNDTEIYENDILVAQINKRKKAIVKVWYMAPEWKLADYSTGELNGSYDMRDFGYGESVYELEVIGNVHQNKELLEGK